MVKGSVSAQNYVLLYPAPGSLFAKTKFMSGRCLDTEVKSRYIWSAVWVKGAGPASLLREHGLKERCLAYDAYRIMEKAWGDHILGFGGKLQGNANVELAMPYTSLYTAEWYSLSSSELEDRLCHDAVYLAGREAEIEARWQTRFSIVHSAYSLRSRLNPDRLGADDDLDTESSGVSSHQESDNEWASSIRSGTASSGYESEYDPRPRRRPKTFPKKKAERTSERATRYIQRS